MEQSIATKNLLFEAMVTYGYLSISFLIICDSLCENLKDL